MIRYLTVDEQGRIPRENTFRDHHKRTVTIHNRVLLDDGSGEKILVTDRGYKRPYTEEVETYFDRLLEEMTPEKWRSMQITVGLVAK